MFIESKERIVRDYPVDVPRALDGGKQQIHRVKVAFKLLPRSERNKLSDAELMRKVVVDLAPITLESGEEVAFSPEILEQLLEDDAALIALMANYAQACAGGARRKN